MYGSLLSILLMGMVPVWGAQHNAGTAISSLRISPPALLGNLAAWADLQHKLTASGVAVADLESGQIVFQKDADVSHPMASLTKLMTALIIVENHNMNEVVTVPQDVGDVIGTVAHLPPGEQFTVGDLLSAALIMSANDAAVTLARFHSGSVEAFVEEMNNRAKELGLTATSYENPVGLDDAKQHSSPHDLAWLAMYVMKKPEIADRMSTKELIISTISGKTLTLIHTHQLLHTDSKEILAGKTGTTDAAGECLLSIVEANGRRYIAVLLHSTDRYADMKQVLKTLSQ